MREGCLTHCWNPAVLSTIRQKAKMAKTKMPCPPPAPALVLPASASQQTVRFCAAWLMTHHRPKFCGSFLAGWSQWWRRRSPEGEGGEEVVLEVEGPQRRQPWRTVLDFLMNQTKTVHHQAQTIKLKGLLANLFRTKTLL